MKKGDILEGIIERVDFPNKGRVYTEDGMGTVKNGIPGQKIRFVIHKKRKNQAEAHESPEGIGKTSGSAAYTEAYGKNSQDNKACCHRHVQDRDKEMFHKYLLVR